MKTSGISAVILWMIGSSAYAQGNWHLDLKKGANGSAPGDINRGTAIAYSDAGLVAVGESFNERIQLFNQQGDLLDSLAPPQPVADLTFGPDGLIRGLPLDI